MCPLSNIFRRFDFSHTFFYTFLFFLHFCVELVRSGGSSQNSSSSRKCKGLLGSLSFNLKNVHSIYRSILVCPFGCWPFTSQKQLERVLKTDKKRSGDKDETITTKRWETNRKVKTCWRDSIFSYPVVPNMSYEIWKSTCRRDRPSMVFTERDSLVETKVFWWQNIFQEKDDKIRGFQTLSNKKIDMEPRITFRKVTNCLRSILSKVRHFVFCMTWIFRPCSYKDDCFKTEKILTISTNRLLRKELYFLYFNRQFDNVS